MYLNYQPSQDKNGWAHRKFIKEIVHKHLIASSQHSNLQYIYRDSWRSEVSHTTYGSRNSLVYNITESYLQEALFQAYSYVFYQSLIGSQPI